MLVLVCYAKRKCERVAQGIQRTNSINAAASKTRLVHNVQSVCSREYMRNYLQYNARNVCSIRLVCVVRLQFAVAKQRPAEKHMREQDMLGSTNKVGYLTMHIMHAAASITRGY